MSKTIPKTIDKKIDVSFIAFSFFFSTMKFKNVLQKILSKGFYKTIDKKSKTDFFPRFRFVTFLGVSQFQLGEIKNTSKKNPGKPDPGPFLASDPPTHHPPTHHGRPQAPSPKLLLLFLLFGFWFLAAEAERPAPFFSFLRPNLGAPSAVNFLICFGGPSLGGGLVAAQAISSVLAQL
jgi:hypothetical protein